MLKRIIVILVVLACAAGGIWWLYDGKRPPSDLLTLYGNVDIRQVDVGFRVGGRVTELFKEEGDAVKTGERLARLDAKPYEEVFDQAAAQLSMQEIELRKMVAGYRTEDIEQARATLSGAQAVYANAASNLRRVERLRQQNAVSQQSLDEARASYGDALSRRNAAREQLQLMESGYRSEDVERQKAAVEAARAELARATTNLQDTELFAPQIHQSRLDSWPQHYPWIKEEGYFYFRSRLSQANRDVEHGLALAKAYCDSAEKQNRMLEILQFKLDILWSMLDAMTMAYALQRPPYHTVTDKAAWHTTRLV